MGKEEVNYKTVLGSSDEASFTVKYTETLPQGDWMASSYTAGDWKSCSAPIGDDAKQVKSL
ncbi:glutaminase [Arcticibacter svalbardensis MN12-7]|uniref:Glutaminase n=1 Tax=Arcticibacter svalbardensis MN12-7 TaxID=1150600 RepID=R9GSJ2_9SPHI|nr:hypothetical protein [Arcticibacter svalbardensis]EOR94643.1 glutaminase [Arcticibacter svalbardensis MN12-7]